MKRLLINLLLCGVAVAATGAPLEVRIKTTSDRMLSGAFVERGAGFVLFRLEDISKTARIADHELAFVKFAVEEDLDAVKRQFDDGAYSEAASVYNRVLPQFLPYSALPSNLSEEFNRWMTASFWSGDYDRTLKLATVLKATSGSVQAEFYSWLARLEQGEYEAMAAFMKSADAETVFPENSAARYYILARLLQHEGRPLEAIRTITRLIARHSRDVNWMPKAELLCAELYFELDQPESAQAVLADIRDFYSSEDIQKKAAALAAGQKVEGEYK